MLAFYRTLLKLRRTEPALAASSHAEAAAPDPKTIILRRRAPSGEELLVVARFAGRGVVDLTPWVGLDADHRWAVVLTSEDDPFLTASELASVVTPFLVLGPVRSEVRFVEPSAVILRAT